MNLTLDSLIEQFRAAQDRAVEVLTEQLQIPRPTSNREWPSISQAHHLSQRCERNGIRIYSHGYGIELQFDDLIIDFDWGENGEPDGFDAWRLYNFAIENCWSVSFSYETIQTWLEEALAAGELTRAGTLYNDPQRRSVQHAE